MSRRCPEPRRFFGDPILLASDFYLFQIYIPGTIDKEYPKKTGGYAFEFGEEAAAKRIISRVNPVFDVQFVTAFKKDSQELNDDDR